MSTKDQINRCNDAWLRHAEQETEHRVISTILARGNRAPLCEVAPDFGAYEAVKELRHRGVVNLVVTDNLTYMVELGNPETVNL